MKVLKAPFFPQLSPSKAQVQGSWVPTDAPGQASHLSAHLFGAGRDRRSCGCVVLVAVSQQGPCRCAAIESHTAVCCSAAQHFCLFPDREVGLFW